MSGRYEDLETVSAEDRARLEAAGYRPVLRWEKASVVCSTGEALKNIEDSRRRAKCTHARGGDFHYCGKCGALMPWWKPLL